MATMSPLRRRMIEDMTIRNLSPATQQSYLYAVAKFSRHFGVPPAQLGTEQVRAYQLHLIAQKRSWSHINQVACALRFFYGVTLGQKEVVARIVSGREPEKLPPVLNPEEIVRFLDAVAGLRNRVALTTAYAAGLRVGEVARLKVPARALCAAHGSSDRPVPPVRRPHGRPWSFAAPPQAGLAPPPPMRQLMTLHSKSASPSITSAGRCSLPLDPNAPRGVPDRAVAGMRHTQPCGPVSARLPCGAIRIAPVGVRPLRAGPNPLLTARARIERP